MSTNRFTLQSVRGAPLNSILKVVDVAESLITDIHPSDCALLLTHQTDVGQLSSPLDSWGAVLSNGAAVCDESILAANCIVALEATDALICPGDVVHIDCVRQRLSRLYRRGSRNNSLFVTERCNSNCIMCSQPPVARNDDWRVLESIRTIKLIDRDEAFLGITGGEPTLLGDGLVGILSTLHEHLPNTQIHLLTNGRHLSCTEFTAKLAAESYGQVVWAVPVYADDPETHDFVVQSTGAFEETISGLISLAELGQRVEIRVVLQRSTVARLPSLAHFISRNLPFVEHVALMGLEPMGFARANWDSIWLPPGEFVPQLTAAIGILNVAGIPASIYNLPLCTIPSSLHRWAVRSISDWKNVYLPECDGCDLRSKCGGFFSSARDRFSPDGIVAQRVFSRGAT